MLIGCDIKDKRVLIVDDVITAGTAIGEAATLVTRGGGILVGIAVGLDRQERVSLSKTMESAAQVLAITFVSNNFSPEKTQEIQKQFSCPVIAVIQLKDIENFWFSQEGIDSETALQISKYRQVYGGGEI